MAAVVLGWAGLGWAGWAGLAGHAWLAPVGVCAVQLCHVTVSPQPAEHSTRDASIGLVTLPVTLFVTQSHCL